MDKSCGLDVHKDSVFACILDAQGKKFQKSVTGRSHRNSTGCATRR
jgi:hypothetical protein